ncbi:MAG: NAD(P)H-dependent glycerol-3-phosphate dehydrogenase, partial [Bacteroidota bacterium]|nr:NAD(P)H-dependent glycerol-3-phosphate dehydrogenase [Bacteroidota bacterium]
MNEQSKVVVIGSGSWATAIVKILLTNVKKISWYIRNPENIEFIKNYKHNPHYLSSTILDIDRITFYDDINEAVENNDVLIFVVPAAFLKSTINPLTVSLDKKLIVSAIKGIVPEHNLTVAEFFHEKYLIPFDRIVVITGPCHAEEIAMERLSYLTFSSKSTHVARSVSEKFECSYVHVIISTDIYGAEYAAILKNIIAIAAGICHGLGYGDNFQAVLVSNAIMEIKRFLDETHPGHRIISSSAYLGDLLVTSYSQFSRNRTYGMMIGKGYSVKSAQLEMNMVAEGYYAVKSIKEINKKYKVNMPITDAVYNIIYEKISPVIEIKLL